MFVTGVQTCALPIYPSTDSDSVLTSADPDSGNPPALTLKDAVITSSFNQLFYIKAGAEPTLRIEGENRIEIMSDLIYNLGTLTLTVADAQEISQGILNGSPAGTGTLTVYAQAPLSIGAISNFQNAWMHLDGEIHVIRDRKSTRLNSSHKHRSRMPSSA